MKVKIIIIRVIYTTKNKTCLISWSVDMRSLHLILCRARLIFPFINCPSIASMLNITRPCNLLKSEDVQNFIKGCPPSKLGKSNSQPSKLPPHWYSQKQNWNRCITHLACLCFFTCYGPSFIMTLMPIYLLGRKLAWTLGLLGIWGGFWESSPTLMP